MKIKKIWWLFLPLFAVALLGAYLSVASTVQAVKYIPIAATGVYILLSLIITGLDKQIPSAYRFDSNMLSGLSLLLMGTLMAVDFFKSVQNINDEKYGYFYVLNVVLMLLAGIMFIVLGLESAAPKIGSRVRKMPLLMLIPSAYFCTRLVIKFLSYTTSAVAGTDMMDLIYISLILLFVFYFTVMYVGFENKGTVKYLYVFGLAAVILCVSHSLSYMYGLYKSGASIRLNENIRVYEDVLMCVYIISYLFEMTKNIYAETKVEAPVEQMSEEDKKIEKIIEEYDTAETVREELEQSSAQASFTLPDTDDGTQDNTDINTIEDKINKLIDDIFDEDKK